MSAAADGRRRGRGRSAPRLALIAATIAAALLSPAAQARRCPNVMFVVATSAAMLGPNGNPPTYFDLTREAVSAAADKYTSFPFGLELFRSNASDDAQCFLDTAITVPVGAGSGPSIRRALYAASAGGSTNLGDAIRRAAEDGHLDDPRRDNVIIVFTASGDDCHSGAPGSQYAVEQVKAAAARSPAIRTAVVGWDRGATSPVFNALAIAGGFADGCNPFGQQPCYFRDLEGISALAAGLVSAPTDPGRCDDSCFANPGDCAAGQVCAFPAPGVNPACVADPCRDVSCGAGQYCRQGRCTSVCPWCPAGQYCVGGTCMIDKCDGARWNEPLQYCDPQVGVQTSKCTKPLDCPLSTYCDPATGACTDNPCRLINCPAHGTCNPSGWCEADPPTLDMASGPDLTAVAPPDAAGPSEPATGGCSCAVAGGPARGGGGDALAILLAALALLQRRRA